MSQSTKRNIGSEASAKNNAFMYSLIESCRHNKLDPGRYIGFLLGKLKSCNCSGTPIRLRSLTTCKS